MLKGINSNGLTIFDLKKELKKDILSFYYFHLAKKK